MIHADLQPHRGSHKDKNHILVDYIVIFSLGKLFCEIQPIAFRCITKYRRSCKISINGRSSVAIANFLPFGGKN